MIKRTRNLRSDLISRVALVSITAGVLAGCSAATERFGEAPVYTGGTSNQRAILANGSKQPTYEDIVNGPGGTVAGLPAASRQPVTTGSITRNSISAPVPAASKPRSIARSNPVARTPAARTPVMTAAAPEVASTVSNSWRGWTATGGTRIPVRSGDSVKSLSRRYGVPENAIVAVNGIEDPAQVRPGQTIIIPTYVYADNTRTGRSVPSPAKPAQLPRIRSDEDIVTGSVRPAEVATIGAPLPEHKPHYQPSFAEVRNAAVVSDATPIRISASPKSKPASGRATSGTPRRVASVSGSVPTPQAMPKHSSATRSVSTAVTAPAVTGSEARPTKPIERPQIVASVAPAEDSGPSFRWPVRGRIISEFGTKPGGTRNDGVNLAVPEGTPVKAADDGTVIYSGNELKGYGNLVLLRHENGWVSAYAHNSKLNVKRGDTVSRGDVVGLAGASGSVSQPQVHFELRRGNKPVDPLAYLPKS